MKFRSLAPALMVLILPLAARAADSAPGGAESGETKPYYTPSTDLAVLAANPKAKAVFLTDFPSMADFMDAKAGAGKNMKSLAPDVGVTDEELDRFAADLAKLPAPDAKPDEAAPAKPAP